MCSVIFLPSIMPITFVFWILSFVIKSDLFKSLDFTEFKPMGLTRFTFEKRFSSITLPPQITVFALHSSKLSNITISAFLPGAIIPLSFSPNASDADKEADLYAFRGLTPISIRVLTIKSI